jgi:hypothetical protein
MNQTFVATIHRTMYDTLNTKYIDITLPRKQQEIIYRINKRGGESVETRAFNPLSGNVLSVKVPWRYKRIDCTVKGIVPVQDFEVGDEVMVEIKYCGTWTTGTYWKFISVERVDSL